MSNVTYNLFLRVIILQGSVYQILYCECEDFIMVQLTQTNQMLTHIKTNSLHKKTSAK